MRMIDEEYTRYPFYGTRRIAAVLRQRGIAVGRDHVRSLMRTMGIEAIYQKPNLSQPNIEHRVYPYLLRGVKITECNHVWSTDITYIPMRMGFLYLVAVIDWHSRYLLSWKLSNTLDADFCIEALQEALLIGQPRLFNTDQGSQFTSNAFVGCLISKGIQVSMDGRGRATDNIFIERLWRSLKYEDIYMKDYSDGLELYNGLSKYFDFYNKVRPHQSLGYKTPLEVYGTRRI
jgi:putative transposase